VVVAAAIVAAEPKDERARRIRGRNRALLAVLVGLVALFYVTAIVRMGMH
jgi:hypothetical protein